MRAQLQQIAGAEVMARIGHATKHSNEIRGFHAPGTTGPFGAAVAVGRLHQFDAEKMTNALGIAGSCAGGLLEFVNSGDGAMVKRLHLGRAAESGVLAASLAADGFTVMNDANNHSYDFGPEGLEQTIAALHRAGIVQDGLPGEITVVRML